MIDMLTHLLDKIYQYPIIALSHLLLLLPVCIAMYRQKFLTSTLSLVLLYFAVHFIEETLLLYYVLIYKKTISLQKGFFFLDIILLTEIFYFSYKNNKQLQKMSVIFAIACGLIVFINYQTEALSFISASTLKSLIIILSLAYFHKILSENRVKKIVLHSMFWISCGFLIYGMGTFMTSVFTDYLLDDKITSDQTFDLFWNMGQLLSIIHCVLVAIGLWVSKFDRENYIQPT